LPLRVTVSERAFKSGGLELKVRRNGETVIVQPEHISAEVLRLLHEME